MKPYCNSNLTETLAHGGLWIAQVLNVICFIPQMLTNYKKKSGKGISSVLLAGYLNAFLLLMFFVFLNDLPIAYKIMVPLEVLAAIVLIVQRLYYDNDPQNKKYWYALGLNLLAFALLIPVALSLPVQVGAFCGWTNLIISTVYQLPQVVKIQREKSVKGFNFLFVAFCAGAATLEITASFFTYLPAQTCFSACRALVICAIMSLQFHWYKKKSTARDNRSGPVPALA